MTEIINVIFVAEYAELAWADGLFDEQHHTRLILKTDNHEAALNAARQFKNSVVVMRVHNPADFKWLAEALSGAGIKYVCMCLSAKDGFYMLQHGAADMLTRSEAEYMTDIRLAMHVLASKVHTAYEKYFEKASRPLKQEHGIFDKIIAIGSSTGGTDTVLDIIKHFPADAPPVLIVQHMPPVFTRLYAERMHSICKMSVWEAQDGDVLKRGLVLLAPGEFQMELKLQNGVYSVSCKPETKVSIHCPSVDVLFHSVAELAGSKAIGIILTGMGKDGAKGLLEMRKRGAMTFGQDEASCVVYGMPKEAYDIGAVVKQLPASEIAGAILEYL